MFLGKKAKCFPRNCHIQLSKYCPPNLSPFPPAVQRLEWVYPARS